MSGDPGKPRGNASDGSLLSLSLAQLTVTGKKLEVAVKKLVNGAVLESLSTSGMANPEALQFFVKHPELQF